MSTGMTILMWATDWEDEGPDWVLSNFGKLICKAAVTWYSLQGAAVKAK